MRCGSVVRAEKTAGIQADGSAMWPGSSVSGTYFSAPESKYFAVGKLDRDRLLAISGAKESERPQSRGAGPHLNYENRSVSMSLTTKCHRRAATRQ